MNQIVYKKLYAKALRYLGLRLRTEQEMRGKVEEWIKGLDYAVSAEHDYQELVEQLLQQLRRERFIDDERFAQEWLASRLRRGKKGPVVIRMELRQKGIEPTLIERVMNHSQELSHGAEVEDGLRMAAEKYLPRLKGETGPAAKAKMAGFLIRRGFSSSDAYRVIKELLS